MLPFRTELLDQAEVVPSEGSVMVGQKMRGRMRQHSGWRDQIDRHQTLVPKWKRKNEAEGEKPAQDVLSIGYRPTMAEDGQGPGLPEVVKVNKVNKVVSELIGDLNSLAVSSEGFDADTLPTKKDKKAKSFTVPVKSLGSITVGGQSEKKRKREEEDEGLAIVHFEPLLPTKTVPSVVYRCPGVQIRGFMWLAAVKSFVGLAFGRLSGCSRLQTPREQRRNSSLFHGNVRFAGHQGINQTNTRFGATKRGWRKTT